MQDKNWFVFQNSKQEGPFPLEHLVDMHHKKMLSQSCYLFKTGWKDWKPIEDCLEELDLKETVPPPPPIVLEKRRREAPRATIEGEVLIHNDKSLLKGTAANISATGLFVATKEELFTVGDKIRLTCKIKEIEEPFQVHAHVIRFSKDKNHMGYGLAFDDLNAQVRGKIDELLQLMNRKKAAS